MTELYTTVHDVLNTLRCTSRSAEGRRMNASIMRVGRSREAFIALSSFLMLFFSTQSFHCTKHSVLEDQHKGQSHDRESSHNSNRIFPRLNGRGFPHASRKSPDTFQRGTLAKRSSMVRLGKSKLGFLNFECLFAIGQKTKP